MKGNAAAHTTNAAYREGWARAFEKLREDEAKWLSSSSRCDACGHLDELHNSHCCTFCMVPGCPCEWDEMPAGDSR